MPNWKKVVVSGSDATLNSLNLTNATAGATVFSIDGTEGRLFSITDELSGSLFAVSDISGIPSFEVFSDDTVKIGTYNSESIVVSGSELKLSHLSTQGSETDVLTINGSDVVGTRQLSSGAFTSAYSLPLATSSTRGGVKIGYSENGKNYPVELSSEKMYVNVPWSDTNTNTTYSAGSLLDLSGTTFNVDLSELTDMTQAWVNSSDEFVVLDNGVQKRKLGSEIFGSNAFNSTAYIPTSHAANNHTSTHLYMSNGDGFIWNDTTNVMSVRKDGTDYVNMDADGGTFTGNVTFNGEVTLGGTSQNPKDITIGSIGVSATENTSLMMDGNGILTTRNLSTQAFSNYSLPAGSSSTRGGFKIGYSENGKNYPVEVSSEKMYVNVPWSDTNTNTTYSAGTGLSLSGTTFSNSGVLSLVAGSNISLSSLTGVVTITATNTNTVDMGDGFKVVDGDGTTVTIDENKYIKFVEGSGIDIDFTDVSNGSSTDPFDLKITNTITNNNQLTNGAGYITDGNTGWNNSYGFITGLDWTEIGGSQSNINISGFTNDSGYITSFTNTMGNGFKIANSAGTSQFTVTESEKIRFAGSGATSVAFDSSTQKVTISSTDTNTTYSVGDGGLTQKNFTTTLKNKLDGIATGATNVTNNNQLTNGAGYITSFTDTNTVTSIRRDNTGTYRTGNINLVGGTNVTISEGSAGVFTITSTDTNTQVTNNNQITNGAGYRTAAQVNTAIQAVVDAAPAALDTLNEIAASLGDDDDFAGSMTTALAGKLSTSGKAADSNLLDGLDLHTGRNNEANKVVRTNTNGYADFGWINTTSGATTSTINRVYCSGDGYIRYMTPTNFRNQIISAGSNVSISATGVISATDTNTDTNTTYSAGSLLDLSGTTFNVDLSELTDKTDGIDASVDEIVLLDNGAQRRKRFAEIFGSNAYNSTTIPTNTNQLTNGAGFITDGNTNWNNSYGFITGLDWTEIGGSQSNINISGFTNDAGYVTTNTNQLTTFQVEDGDGTEVTISHGKEWKFTEGQGININWTDTTPGSDADPYDLRFSLKSNEVNATQLNVSGNGTTTQFLRSDGDGTFTWATPTDTNTTYSVGDGGLTQKNFTTTLKNKLDGIATGATNVTNNNQLTNGAGYITSFTDTNTTYSPGALLDLSGTTFNVDLSELTDMTAAIDASVDEIVLLDNGAQRRKRFTEIFGSNAYNSTTIPTNNNQLTNGAGYITSYTDTNTTYSAGTGLTLSGTTFSLTTPITNNNQLTNGAGYTTNTGTTTPSNTQTFTNKSGNISQWTNDSGYTTNAGVVTSVGVGTGLDVSTSIAVPVITLDLSELTDKTDGIDASVDEIIMLDNGAERRKRFSEIFGSNAYNSTTIPTNTNQLTNGAGFITDGNTGWNNSYGFITGVDWTEIGGSQSNIDISGFTNDAGYITSFTNTMGGGFKVADSAGTSQFTITEAEKLRFAGSGAASVSFDSSTQKVTISSTNTTYSAGGGLGLSGTTFSHSNTSGQSSVNNSGNTVIQDISLDGYGHVTGLTSKTLSIPSSQDILDEFSAGTGIEIDEGEISVTLSANSDYGTRMASGQILLADDRRRNSSTVDIKTGNTHDYTWYDDQIGIKWYTAGAEEMRLLNDGTLHVDGDVVAYSGTVSDERLKDNVTTIENPLDKIKALRGVEYDWNAGSRKGKHDLGVIAQEVEKVLPNIVHEHQMPLLNDDEEDETLYKTVDYEKMVAVLIEGMKEQQSQIDELKLEINKLKGDV